MYLANLLFKQLLKNIIFMILLITLNQCLGIKLNCLNEAATRKYLN